MKRFFLTAVFLFATTLIGTAALACELNFTVLSKDGEEVEVRPGKEIKLTLGDTYTMKVEFVQDHRNCVTPPEATVYLLQEEKWNSSKEYLPLMLNEQKSWNEISPGTWVQELIFTAHESGKAELEIIRDCPKGGYDETLEFKVK